MQDCLIGTAAAVQLSHRSPCTDLKLPAADYGFPEQLMGWLSRRALIGSAYVRLDASSDGNRGCMIVTSYDEHDRVLAYETFDLYAAGCLMTS